MKRLILINGNGGAGKNTNAQVLYARLPNSAWIHMRWLLALKRWQPTDHYVDLGIRNAAAVIHNYYSDGVDTVIYSGNVFDQRSLDLLLSLLQWEIEVFYFWLDADKKTRRTRLIGRARDEGDRPEVVDQLLAKYSKAPPNLVVRNGKSITIDAAHQTPQAIVDEITGYLQ